MASAAIYGDATHPATLGSAGIDHADNFIVSVAGLPGVEESFRSARELNPVRADPRARQLPARGGRAARGRRDVVVSGEGEVALGFTEAILGRLGATPEQIDRERARVHAELGQSA